MTNLWMPKMIEVRVLEWQEDVTNMDALFETGVVSFRGLYFEIANDLRDVMIDRLIINEAGALEMDKCLLSGSQQTMQQPFLEFIDYAWLMTHPYGATLRSFEEYREEIKQGTAIRYETRDRLNTMIPMIP